MAATAAILVLLITIRQFLAGDLLALWAGRVGTETLNPISLGHLGASLAILATYRLVWKPPAGLLRRFLLTGSLLLGAATTAVAASRGPILAGVAAISGLWLMPLRGRTRTVMLAVTTAMALCAVAMAARAEDELGIPLVSRVAALAEAREDQTVGMRVTYIRDAWDQFMEHPVLGSALEELSTQRQRRSVHGDGFLRWRGVPPAHRRRFMGIPPPVAPGSRQRLDRAALRAGTRGGVHQWLARWQCVVLRLPRRGGEHGEPN
jgi:hypothetical protein